MTEPTIEQIVSSLKSEKHQLELEIAALLLSFTKRTGLRIAHLSVQTMETFHGVEAYVVGSDLEIP